MRRLCRCRGIMVRGRHYSTKTPTWNMKIAVEGCCHGSLDKIYEVLTTAEQREGCKIDLLICCGDFQAVRNDEDLCCMACPPKYRHMETFYKYYSGEKKAPILTLFIGGNHEASNHLWELSYGGWVAPNIYYLGNAGVVRIGGLRIAGLSGIYKPGDYNMTRYEQPPYNQGTMRSTYHVRSCDVFRLKQLSGHVDIMLSHDWPQGIYHYGNKDQLIRIKPHFAEEISRDSLGSPPAMDLLEKLKPSYWFSAHLHVKFAALYPHSEGHTKFLALDKCLPRRQFLQILDIGGGDVSGPYKLEHDPEWLTILSLTEPLMQYSHGHWVTPSPLTHQRWQYSPTSEELDDVIQRFGDLTVAENFVTTVTPYNEGAPISNRAVAPARENSQTTEFCQRLGIANPFRPPQPLDEGSEAANGGNPDEINLDSSDSDGGEEERETNTKSDESATQAGRTEEGVVWSVEKRPGLHLPQPTRSHDDHVITTGDAEVKGEEDKDGEECQDATLVDSTDIPESSDQLESDQPQEQQGQRGRGGVVIKRRNQAMYDDPNDTTQ